jgi:hypothetical protein
MGGGFSGGAPSGGGHFGGGFSGGGHPGGGGAGPVGRSPGGGPSYAFHAGPGPGHGGHPGPGPRIGWHGYGPWPGFFWVGDFHFLAAPPVGYVVVSFGDVNYYRCGYAYYRPYWYDEHWVYVEVPPPTGLVVTQLPPSPDRVVINGQVYYRSGTTFYVAKSADATAATTAALSTTTAVPVATANPVTTTASTLTTTAVVTPTAAPLQPAGTPVGNVTAQTGPEIVAPGYVVAKPPIGAIVELLPGGTEKIQVGSTTYYRAGDVYYLPITVGQKAQYVIVQKPN